MKVLVVYDSMYGNTGKIGKTLKNKGGNLLASPEAFFVKGNKGPLKEGELERAVVWAKGITAAPEAGKE